MKQFFSFFISLCTALCMGQNTISGVVMDKDKAPVIGANVYLEGTYDGASTDENGKFTFQTHEEGTQTLTVSAIAYETYVLAGDVKFFAHISITLQDAINSLSGVTLTAGTFEAGDNSKVSVLKPLDIVTTAGAVGDFVAALQTLPGTSTVNEDGRLFVRGGAAGETQVFIDGLRVFQPFSATANNVPTRGRFSPFLFKGITFSTGGYSAEYGQALSSVLLLNTTDVPDQEKTDISIMSVGGGLGHTEIWGNQSLSVNTSYINLAPYEALLPSDQGVRWNSPFESISGEGVFRSKADRSILKMYTGFTRTNLDIDQEDINTVEPVQFQLRNNNLYFNSSFKYFFEQDWTLTTGASISYDTNAIGIDNNSVTIKETALHVKAKIAKRFSNKVQTFFGGEYFSLDYEDRFQAPNTGPQNSEYTDGLSAFFTETDVFFSNQLAVKLGARAEYSSILQTFKVSPRASLAYKSSEKGQFSLAYGNFYQNPLSESLRFSQELNPERATHYIFNYQYLGNGKTFRAEAFYKDYEDFIKFDTATPQFDSDFSNEGDGYASGLDLFWRDNKGIKDLDYWISYSYLDTERDHRNFRERATPNFAAKHNFSIVTKYWINSWRSQVGLSYNFASGRPYDNPNTTAFLAEKTRSFNNISLNWAYLVSPQKILYFSVNNVLGFNNISGYNYSNSPNANGVFDRQAIRPPADSFFFVGFFWTISTDKKSNQLDNL